jgi:hypothetical protein
VLRTLSPRSAKAIPREDESWPRAGIASSSMVFAAASCGSGSELAPTCASAQKARPSVSSSTRLVSVRIRWYAMRLWKPPRSLLCVVQKSQIC